MKSYFRPLMTGAVAVMKRFSFRGVTGSEAISKRIRRREDPSLTLRKKHSLESRPHPVSESGHQALPILGKAPSYKNKA